jgi:hypothetical protein
MPPVATVTVTGSLIEHSSGGRCIATRPWLPLARVRLCFLATWLTAACCPHLQNETGRYEGYCNILFR